jgi:predicted kinase
VVATTEDEQQLRSVIDAVAADRVLVVCLSASADVVAERVAAREPDSWPGKADLIEHARLLADEVPSIDGIDVVLPTTDWRAVDVAAKVRDLLLEHGVLQRR